MTLTLTPEQIEAARTKLYAMGALPPTADDGSVSGTLEHDGYKISYVLAKSGSLDVEILEDKNTPHWLINHAIKGWFGA